MGQFALGQSVPRTEDPRLLRGGGRYIDDMRLVNQAYGFVLRSPHASAKITAIDTRAAQQSPGVLGVFTGADWAADGMGHFAPAIPRFRRDGTPLFCPPHPALADGQVRMAGEAVVFVVAETVADAKDAAERIEVEYEALPVNVDTALARDPATPALHDGCPDNEAFFHVQGEKETVDAAFEKADHITELHLVINRITAATMEPRVSIGEFDASDNRYHLYAGSQRPFDVRRGLARDIFHIPETQVRVIAGDVGGSFGMKSGQFPEYTLCMWAAEKLRRPVRWTSERSEGMLSDYHDRDQVTDAALALDKDGKFLALKVSNICNVGAYLESGGVISPSAHLGGLAGTYTTPAIYAEASAIFSNTAPIGPYRGSGRPEATYVLERLIDTAAREMDIDPAELRRRNCIPPEDMPFQTGLSYILDCGEFERNLDECLKMADYAGFEDRRAEAAGRGKLRGIGVANFIEQTAQNFGETIRIQFDPSGTVTVVAGSISHGQGHDTMYKVVVSDRLGIDANDIRVTFGDTDQAPWGGGTFASRTAILGGSAAAMASDKLIEKGKSIAAHLLEAATADIEFAAGSYTVAGTDKTIGLQEVARAAFQPASLPAEIEPGFSDMSTFSPEIPTFPNGSHVSEVEIDPDTGETELLRYSVVDDVGTVINKLTLEGQIHGGIGQAVGQVFTEHIVYDTGSGQLVTGSFLDYGMPRADDMCAFDCANNPVPTDQNPLGVKGAGEAGNVGGLACIMNAIVDALSPLGITHIDMPATPQRVWQAIRDAQAAQN